LDNTQSASLIQAISARLAKINKHIRHCHVRVEVAVIALMVQKLLDNQTPM
jgi:hypothetical protein